MSPQSCQSGACGLGDALAFALQPVTMRLSDGLDAVSGAVPWLLPLLAGVLGAAAASLAGVVVDRLPRVRGWNGRHEPGLSLSSPPSHCPSCGLDVPIHALVPVAGWFLAHGRCGGCRSEVPWKYPAIEAAFGLAFVVLVAVLGATGQALAVMLLMWGCLVASWIDWNEHEIPDGLTVPLAFLGLLASPFDPDIQSRVLGAALAGGLVMLAFRITSSAKGEDAMSLGDVALAAALGAWCGLCAIPAFLVCACFGYVAYAAPLRARGVTWVPMGPALCAGLPLGLLAGRLVG